MTKSKTTKRTWSLQEDYILTEAVKQLGDKGWSSVAQFLPHRVGKQCRDRWFNHLRPELKRAPWTPKEDQILFAAQQIHGNSWSRIAKEYLPGRTDLSVKNRYYSFKRRSERISQSEQDAKLLKSIEEIPELVSQASSSSLSSFSMSGGSGVLDERAHEMLASYRLETLRLKIQIEQLMHRCFYQ